MPGAARDYKRAAANPARQHSSNGPCLMHGPTYAGAECISDKALLALRELKPLTRSNAIPKRDRSFCPGAAQKGAQRYQDKPCLKQREKNPRQRKQAGTAPLQEAQCGENG